MSYVIQCIHADTFGEAQFWNNDMGWVDLAGATVFTELEHHEFDLPMGALCWSPLPDMETQS